MSKGANLVVARDRVLAEIYKAGDDGIYIGILANNLGMSDHGVRSLVGQLINRREVTKHPKMDHYFYVENPEKSPLPKMGELSKSAMMESNVMLGLTAAEEVLFDKFLAKLGLKRI